jgi:hypothetical protein
MLSQRPFAGNFGLDDDRDEDDASFAFESSAAARKFGASAANDSVLHG